MGHDLTVYNRKGEKKFNLLSRAAVTAISNASQKISLLADDTVKIEMDAARPLDLTIGDYIMLFGKRYTFNQLPEPAKEGERIFRYSLNLEGLQYQLIDAHYHLPEDAYGETYYANLQRHAEILEWNINRIHPGWSVQVDPDAFDPDNYQNITTTEKNALAMLQDLCELFGVEFEITAKGTAGLISIKKKAGVTQPFTLRYGRGRGLYQLSRGNVNNAGITNRLYVYGSTENLPRLYGHTKLCLEGTGRLTSYLEDPDSISAFGVREGEKNYPQIKAERVGVVTALGPDRITFMDTSGDPDDPTNLPMFDLNEKDEEGNTKYLIAGTNAKITFQTGNLAGYQFDLHKYDHATKQFIINRFTDENGLIFPNDEQDAFTFAVGDKYIITDIMLPDSYVKQAQGRLEEAARADFPPMAQPQVSYKLGLTEGFFIAMFGKATETEFLHVGDFIHIIDPDIGVDKEVRVIDITRDLLRPHSYELVLSDTVFKSSAVKILNEIKDIQEAISYNTGFTDPTKARRRWLATQELLNMVFDPEGDYYSEKIKPLSIETQMLSVGAKSTQFTLNNVTIQPNFNGDPNAINFSAGMLVHYGIDPENTRPWFMGGVTYSGLNSNTPYYIYARCPRDGSNGTFILDASPRQCEGEAAYYNFLVGVLNSVSDDSHGGNRARLISLTYGSSTINGRFVRCGRIESSGGGATYFDLDTGVISGRILFRSTDGTVKDVSDLENKTAALEDYINNTLKGTLEGLQGQLDGVIEQWFKEVDPTPEASAPLMEPNEPAKTWAEIDKAAGNDNEKEKHLGDLYYNTISGKVWRYVKSQIRPRPGATLSTDDYYYWVELEDTELAQAIKLAQDALAAADDKARIFYVTPYSPYDPGDLWVQGTTGDILVCTKGRAAGAVPAFDASEWKKASKYTDDSALNNFINNQYAGDKEDLLNQIDGKIECFYTATNPANSWPSSDYARHIGDQWYNTSTKILYRWDSLSWSQQSDGRWLQSYPSGVTTGIIFDSTNHKTWFWRKIENADAEAAAAAAAAAQGAADGKSTIFVATPSAPYYVGDLWLKDVDSTGTARSGIWRCVRDNTVKGTFNSADWVEATYYDCTQTVIDGGIVTAGTIQLANKFTQSIVAGITGGEGTSYKETATTTEENKVRIWAGASEGNRRTAPFRVLQNGKVYATNAVISGKVTSSEGEIAGWTLSEGKMSSSNKDATGKTITPAVELNANDGTIKAAGSVVMDADGFSLIHDGYSMVKVANVSVGEYGDNLLRQSYDRTGSPAIVTQSGVSIYVPYSGAAYNSNPYQQVTIPLGFFEAGSSITLGQCSIGFTVPYHAVNRNAGVWFSTGSGIRVRLIRDGVTVGTYVGGSVGGVSHGSSVTLSVNPNLTKVIGKGEQGNYSLLIDSPGNWQWQTESGTTGNLATFSITTQIRYKFTRGNYQRTLLGYDGLVSTWTNGYMFLNGEAFVVKFGNYVLKINQDGIQKSTNGGSSYSQI